MIKSSYISYFLSLIKTKSYADEVVEKIDELKESLYNKRIDLDKKMGQLFSFELKEKIMALSWEEQVNLHNPDSFGAFLSKLRTLVKNMPVVKVSIPVRQTEDIVNEIHAWFIANFGKNVVIDLSFDPNLIAGIQLDFDGSKKDFSLIKKLEEKFKESDWKKFVTDVRQTRQVHIDENIQPERSNDRVMPTASLSA